MAIPARFIEELKERVSIADVIGRTVRLQKKGQDWLGLCPFHKEKTPSFSVSDAKGFYYCFGCGAKGSAIDFVMEDKGLSFPEAVETLASMVGMSVPQETEAEKRRTEQAKTLSDVCEAACAYYERMLQMPEGKHAAAYLQGRGLNAAIIRHFRIGFAPMGKGQLRTTLESQNISERLMIDAGLLIEPEADWRDNKPYERFRGRIMFPIMDRKGSVIAFGGRLIPEVSSGDDGDTTPTSAPAGNYTPPKYLNSPETALFHKGRTLYGISQALPTIRKQEQVIVCEGYMDVIALAMNGYGNAVAPLGTALTDDHLSALWRLVPEPVLCFDGDAAGQRAAGRAAERALSVIRSGKGLRFAMLPEGEDPDSLVSGNDPALPSFDSLLTGAWPLSEVLWRMKSADRVLRTPEQRASLQKSLDDMVRTIQDPVMRGHFKNTFRERLWQASGGKKNQRRDAYTAYAGGRHDAPLHTMPSKNEEAAVILIATLMNHPALYDTVAERLGMFEGIISDDLDNLRQEVLAGLDSSSGLDATALYAYLCKRGFSENWLKSLGRNVFFVKQDASLDDARMGWEETWQLATKHALEAEILQAKERYFEEPNNENWNQLQALQRHHLALRTP